jgi:replicative DNA helicase
VIRPTPTLEELLAAKQPDRANALLDAKMISNDQTNTAMRNLFADPGECVEFPYPSLDAIVGRIAPGRLVFVMANTGQGKTTLMLDTLDRWAERHVQVDYVGTEQEPEELRTKWACLRVDVPAGVAVNRQWDKYDMGEYWREKVVEEMAKIDDAYARQVKFHPDKFVTLAKIEAAAKDAALRGAKVLMVDHIDRVETGATDSEYLALKRIVRRLKELARDHKMVLIVASQVNRKSREGDRLAAYRPPQLHHMQGAATKEHEADVVLGVWRPIRQRKGSETPKEFSALLKAARAGDTAPLDVVDSNVMAVVCLKHRTENHEGMRCKLSLYHGRLTDLSERDRWTTAGGIAREVIR